MHRCRRDDFAALRSSAQNRRQCPWTPLALRGIGTLAILAAAGAASAQLLAGSGAAPPGCPQADLGSTLPTLVSGTTADASSALSGSCGGDGPEATFLFTAPVDGTYLFDTSGSDFDTVLYLRAASCTGEELACNDDSEGVTSQVTVDLMAGESIVVVVDSLDTGGDFTLSIALVDTTLPELTALSFPSTVDLRTDPPTVPVSYTATDDRSGVAFFSITFEIPGTGCGVSSFDDSFAPALSRSGQVSVDLPEDAPPGVYAVCALDLCDAQENCHAYSVAELPALGFPAAVTVVGGPPVPGCSGDCGDDGAVTIDEIITLVSIALGNVEPSACPHGIPADREVDIALIVQSVGHALTTCPA
jgi:hypothetical protein